MPRITRIAGSFVIVVIAYWAYALLVVRWIEPSADLGSSGEITDGDRQRGRGLVDMQLEQFQQLFSPNDWELNNPKILETDRAKLLFQDYKNLGGGRVEITKCTIVFPYVGPAVDPAQRLRQAIILQAPGGATLQFDQPLDINQGKISRLVGGRLKGRVTIRSDWKEPGPEDDLLITTQDIELTEQTVSTPNPVDFRWGPHFGRGQDMMIRLLAGQPSSGMEGSATNVNGIKSFELRRVERLHLDLGQTISSPGENPGGTPVEINCRGPFRFDVVGRVATFRERVEVLRINPAGPPDQLTCDLLSLYFTSRAKEPRGREAVKTARKPSDALDLAAQRIEATGNPVAVTVDSLQDKGGTVVARGQRTEYDLEARSVVLDGGQEVFLQQGPNQIYARSIYYQSSGSGRLGRIFAQGPGRLCGQSPDRADQQLEVEWPDRLRVEPQGENQVISMTSGPDTESPGIAKLRFPGVGELQAPEIFVWLQETPNADDAQSRLRPRKMLARPVLPSEDGPKKDALAQSPPKRAPVQNYVRIESPQLSGQIAEQLEVWFEEGATERPGTSVPGVAPAGFIPQSIATRPRPNAAAPVRAAAPLLSRQSPGEAAQQVKFLSRKLAARVLVSGSQTTLSNLSLDGDVSFVGRDMRLTGPNLTLNSDTNRLTIDGPGQMILPFSFSLPGQAPAAPGVLTVDWRRRMNFDGLTATFESVFATTTQHQDLDTETMIVTLQRPIRFSEPDTGEPEVEQIQCLGGVDGLVVLRNRSFDSQQRPTSFDQLHITDLVINRRNGEMKGGSGWLNSVQYGSPSLLENPTAAGSIPARAAPPQDQLKCLHVRFQKSTTGNLSWRQHVTFDDHVKAAYAPVNGWDAVLTTTNPDQLGPDSVATTCDQLNVDLQLVPLMKDRRSIAMQAQGNARVDGAAYTARGNRITYDQYKEQLILEGDGFSDAELWYEAQIGAERQYTAARKFLYLLRTHTVQVDKPQSLHIGQFPPGTSK